MVSFDLSFAGIGSLGAMILIAVCSNIPFLASIKMIARFAVEAPVTIFLVY